MLQISWCVIIPDDSDVIAETCRKNGKFTVLYTVYANAGFVSKTLPLFHHNDKRNLYQNCIYDVTNKSGG
jgi:hypothetical protein